MQSEFDLEQQLRDYLGILVRLAPLPAGFRYRGPADLVLQTGRSFIPAPLPAGRTPGAPGYCFDNAYQLAARSRGQLRYCEGYAAGLFPVEHAWCIDATDHVLDPTWSEPGQVYIGIVIDGPALRAVRRRGSCSALFDWQGNFPLCRQPEAPPEPDPPEPGAPTATPRA